MVFAGQRTLYPFGREQPHDQSDEENFYAGNKDKIADKIEADEEVVKEADILYRTEGDSSWTPQQNTQETHHFFDNSMTPQGKAVFPETKKAQRFKDIRQTDEEISKLRKEVSEYDAERERQEKLDNESDADRFNRIINQ